MRGTIASRDRHRRTEHLGHFGVRLLLIWGQTPVGQTESQVLSYNRLRNWGQTPLGKGV
jgi:hypothetical protein